MDIILSIFSGIYIVFICFEGSFLSYISLAYKLDEESEFSIFTLKGVFNLTFANEVAVYLLIKEYINKIGIAVIMVLWTAICLPINIVAFAFILLGEIISGFVLVFLKLFGKRKSNYNFKVGDKVYVDDWFYGTIVDIDGETAWCEFETFGGGGTLCFELKDLKLALKNKGR